MIWPRPKYTKVTSVWLARKEHGAEWYLKPDVVYIGMPGKAQRETGIPNSAVGPFGKPWECLNHPDGWREGYREYLRERIKTDPEFRHAVAGLAGKTLVCWCKGGKKGPDPDCHGDLLAVAAEFLAERS